MDLQGYAGWCEEWSYHPGFDWCPVTLVIHAKVETVTVLDLNGDFAWPVDIGGCG